MKSSPLFRQSRLRLALWYALVMGVILTLSGWGIYRALIQSNWKAMEREMESISGTLHDSLEPMLPTSGEPTAVLRRILPELCLVGQSCPSNPTLVERHTMGISDRSTYYLRLFDSKGRLVAFSPNQPPDLSKNLNPDPWQTLRSNNGTRYHQFTIILHSASLHSPVNSLPHQHTLSSGYLQIGRTLEAFDAEVKRIQWILAIGLPLALGLVVISSWWLSGLAMKPIYQSYQQQQQFTANAAHELRSPLASLLTTVEAILRLNQDNNQEIKTMLMIVERQGRRLSNLVTDLLFLTRLETTSSSQTFQPCCLNDLMSDLTEEFAELAAISDINLISYLPEPEIYVLGNESQLYRLVSNLIANAIQYTPNGGKIIVSLKEQAYNTTVITVEDTGIGIAPTEQTRIFERFYRLDNARTRKTGGTGLGLAIAQAICHSHQGHLTVNSQVGQGSLFTIHFNKI